MGQKDLPVAACAAHVKTFTRLGWHEQPKRGKGSHVIMTKPGYRATLSVPHHDPVKRGTLASLIRSAEETIESYCDAFHR